MVKLYHCSLYSITVLCCSSAVAVQVTSNVDAQSLSLGDSLTYTLTTDANLSDDALDIRPLFKDFIIGNLQISHPSTTETTWIIPLQPVSSGEITIPTLKVADSESQQVTITVSDSSNSNQTTYSDQPLQQQTEIQQPAHLLESQISAETAYQNELLTYTVTVVKNADPENKPPIIAKLAGVKITSAGDPVEDKQIFADHYQETLTYTYFVFPEEAGRLTLPSATLASNSKQKSNEHTIEVKSVPPAFHGTEQEWLPSAGIAIEERWEPQTSYVKTGQPLTRTITLTGINNILEQIPDIPTPVITDVRVYRDSEKNEQQYLNGMVISKKIIKQVFVPEKNTPFVTPAIDFNWWNTISDRAQVTSLEERKFMASLGEIKTNQDKLSVITMANKPSATTPNIWDSLLRTIFFIAGASIALLTPIAAILWYYRKVLRTRYERYCLWKNFKRGCLTNDSLLAYRALLVWASQRWGQSFTCLEQLPFYIRLKIELDELQTACFSKITIEWNGKRLLHQLNRRAVLKLSSTRHNSDEFIG